MDGVILWGVAAPAYFSLMVEGQPFSTKNAKNLHFVVSVKGRVDQDVLVFD